MPRHRGFWLDSRVMALLIIATAMAIAGRLAFIWWPNVMLTYMVVAVVAIAYRPMLGAIVGALAMFLTDMMVGFSPISLFTIPGLAMFGFASGILGRATGLHHSGWGLHKVIMAAVIGSSLVIAYSLFTDIGTTILFIGGGGDFLAKYFTVTAAGVIFNLPMIIINGALFGFVLRPVLEAIDNINTGAFEHETAETTA